MQLFMLILISPQAKSKGGGCSRNLPLRSPDTYHHPSPAMSSEPSHRRVQPPPTLADSNTQVCVSEVFEATSIFTHGPINILVSSIGQCLGTCVCRLRPVAGNGIDSRVSMWRIHVWKHLIVGLGARGHVFHGSR